MRILDDIINSGITSVDASKNNLFFTHRLHAINACCLLMMVFNPVFVVAYYHIDQKFLAIMHIVSLMLCFMNILLLRRTKNIDLSAHVLCSIFTLLVFISCVRTGGFMSPNIMWLFLLPVGAGFTINFRASFLYGLVVALAMLMLFKFQQGNFIIFLNVQDKYFNQFYVLQLFTLLVAIVALTYGFLKSYEKALNNLSQSETKYRELSEKAEKSSKFKGEFLANMSHEIRTPLNGIIGMMHMLLETELTNEQKRHFDVVSSSADSLLTIINDVLDFSKVEAGKLEIDNIEFNLSVALRDMNTMFQMQAEQKGIKFRCTFEPGVPEKLCGDPGRIRQVLINLAGNAIKFTDAGEVVVHTRLETEDEHHSVLRFTITDTGIGISQQNLTKIFDPFSQADVSTTRQYGGTGLGLSISKKLVNQMGGDLGVESEEFLGSTFWFTICFEKCHTKADDEIEYLENLHNKKILIAGGSSSSDNHLKKQLKALKIYGVIAQKDAGIVPELEKGIQEGRPYNAVLIDMQMGRGNAENLGILLSNDSRFRKVPMILLTSVGERGDAKLFSQAGYSAYLCKPVDLRLLDDCLKVVLHDKKLDGTVGESIITRHILAENKNHSQLALIADDNETNIIVARELLGRLGYRTDFAHNGKEAVTAFTEKPYDLIIMDCQMPVLDGFEATAEIRKLEKNNRHTPVIAVTANALKGTREKCLNAGMDDYITKPIDLFQLDEAIYRNLNVSVDARDLDSVEEIIAEKDEDQVFNREKMLNRFGGSTDTVNEIIEAFIGESPVLIEKIKKAVNEKDLGEIKSLSHAFKGSSANIHADLIRKAAEEMEDAARKTDYPEINNCLVKIECEYKAFKGEVEE